MVIIRIFEFIEYTEELFDGVKNTIGGKTNLKYYLSDSQALSLYVKKCQKNPNHKFTAANISGFLNKCRYFIYPEKRMENYKVDISVKEFSERCIAMFVKRFGINFSFMRINSDNKKFVAMQKKCLENLFEQIILMFSKQKTFSKNDFLYLLEMYYCRYRFELYNVDMNYLIKNYDVILQSELSDYVICTTNAFHKLKFIYTRATYVIGYEEYIREIRMQYDKQIKWLQSTCRLISDIFDANKKEDVKQYIGSLENHVYNSDRMKEIYVCWNNKYENWKSELLHLYFCNNLPNDISGLSVIATYMLYSGNYENVLNDFNQLCSCITDIRNKHSELYDKILDRELIKFECVLNKFYF